MKKLLFIAVAGAGLAYFLNKKASEPQEQEEQEQESGEFRELTDAEAQNYLNQNSDLIAAFGNDLEKAKEHWRIQGFPFEFENGRRPNPYLL